MGKAGKWATPDFIETIYYRTRSFLLICLIWTAFPMPSNGDLAVGVIQGDVFMSWRVNITDISSRRNIFYPDGSTVISFPSDSVIGSISSTFNSRVRDVGNVSLGIVSFRLLNLTVADAGRYYYRSVVGTDAGGQVLVIAGVPANVSVTEVADPFENEKYTLQCSAQSTSVPFGMGMTMYYQWKNEKGQTMTASDRYSFSSDQSNLTINPLKRWDAGTLVCEAWEHVGAVSQSSPYTLKVLYGPDPGSMILSPNRTYYELAESSPLTVSCNTDCFPDCQYRWTGPGLISLSNTGLLSIISIRRSQTGQYTCTASNSKIPDKIATATASVVVFYGPEAPLTLDPVTTSYRNIEGTFIPNITCSANCNPPCNYQWIGPLGATSSGVLSLVTLDRLKRGSYLCTAINPRTSTAVNGSTVHMVVIYGPDIPRLSPSTTVYTKLEGASVPDVNCSTDCYPGCTQGWMKGVAAVQESHGTTLSLGQVYRDKAGDYTCWFNNTESRAMGYISIRLIVQYPPVLKMKATNTSKGGRVDFSCMASGVPNNYTFYKLTHMAPDESRTIIRELELKRISGSEVSVTIEGATYQDTGFYVCKASNGITHYSTGQLIMEDMVSVWITGFYLNYGFHCHSVPIDIIYNNDCTWMTSSRNKQESCKYYLKCTESSHDQAVITSNVKYFDAEKGKTGYMNIEFYTGLFQPIVTWYRIKNGTMELLQNSSSFAIYLSAVTVGLKYYQNTVQLPGYNASLEVFHVDEDQFASYKVEINNSFGEPLYQILELKLRGPPETPANLSVVPDSVTTHSLQLTWQAGFHGGASQTFVIEYREIGKTNWLTKPEPRGLVLYVIINTAITDLKDGTKYEFRIYSENVYNWSQVSSTVNETTKTVPDTYESPDSLVAGIAGGISAGLVISLVIGIGLILWKRNQRKKQTKHDNDVSREHKERRRSQIKVSFVKQDVTIGNEYEGLHFKEAEANQYLQLNGITLEENRNVNERSPESDSYEKLQPYANNDIQMYSSLKIPKTSKDSEKKYENTWMKRPDTTVENQNQI